MRPAEPPSQLTELQTAPVCTAPYVVPVVKAVDLFEHFTQCVEAGMDRMMSVCGGLVLPDEAGWAECLDDLLIRHDVRPLQQVDAGRNGHKHLQAAMGATSRIRPTLALQNLCVAHHEQAEDLAGLLITLY